MTTQPPEGYFADLEERVLARIAVERAAPTLAQYDKTLHENPAPPPHYFEGLEARVLTAIAAENKEKRYLPLLVVYKNMYKNVQKYAKITALSSMTAAAVLIGVFVFKPKTDNLAQTDAQTDATTNAPLSTPLSNHTEHLFAQLNTAEALSFLQEHASTLDETALANVAHNAAQNTTKSHLSTLKNEDISAFVEENGIILED